VERGEWKGMAGKGRGQWKEKEGKEAGMMNPPLRNHESASYVAFSTGTHRVTRKPS